MSDYEDVSVVQVDESDLQSVNFFDSLTDRFGGDYVSAHDKKRIVSFLNKRLLAAQGYASEGSEHEDLPAKKVCLEVDESDVASTASSSDAASVYVPSEDDEATSSSDAASECVASEDEYVSSVLPVKEVCLEVDESDVASTASSSDAASVYVPSEDDEATKTEFLAQKDLQLQSVCDVLSKRGLNVYLVDHYGGSLVPIHAATIRTRVSIFTFIIKLGMCVVRVNNDFITHMIFRRRIFLFLCTKNAKELNLSPLMPSSLHIS